MKIIFLALSYPDTSHTTNMYTDLMEELKNEGNDLLVVAPCLKDGNHGIQIESGISVLRVKTLELFGISKIRKGIANILMAFQYKWAIKKNVQTLNFDLILMPTPPITLIDVVSWLKYRTGAKMYLILRDIFPQNAVDLGMMKFNGVVHKYFRKKESKLYAIADQIGCMSNGNISYLLKHNPEVDAQKTHILPNWEKVIDADQDTNSATVRKRFNLEGKFIVLFGGNIGKPQKIENIISLAEQCVEVEDIVFVIVGQGTEKGRLEGLISSKKLENILVKNFMVRDEYNHLLKTADVGLISLSEKFTIPNIPSKVLSYFNTKKPVLASIDANTDFGEILDKTKSGVWTEAGNATLLKEKLMYLYANPNIRKEMGLNGYEYLCNHLTPGHIWSTIKKNV